jgi:hypothetical protein
MARAPDNFLSQIQDAVQKAELICQLTSRNRKKCSYLCRIMSKICQLLEIADQRGLLTTSEIHLAGEIHQDLEKLRDATRACMRVLEQYSNANPIDSCVLAIKAGSLSDTVFANHAKMLLNSVSGSESKVLATILIVVKETSDLSLPDVNEAEQFMRNKDHRRRLASRNQMQVLSDDNAGDDEAGHGAELMPGPWPAQETSISQKIEASSWFIDFNEFILPHLSGDEHEPLVSIDQGTFGTVYSGQFKKDDPFYNRWKKGDVVALKRMLDRSQEGLERCYRELEMTASSCFVHPNVVRTYGACLWPHKTMTGCFTIIMELVPMKLETCLQASYEDKLNISIGILEGLAYLHSHVSFCIYLTPSATCLGKNPNVLTSTF